MHDSIADRCPGAAMVLGFDPQAKRARNCDMMHYVANALPTSPIKVDAAGRVRKNGRFVSATALKGRG